MEDLGDESCFGGLDRIILRDCYVESKPSFLEGRVWGTFDKSFPVEEVVVNGPEQDIIILVLRYFDEFFVESVSRHHLINNYLSRSRCLLI